MNEFIILVERDYDCHTVDMPYPIITDKTKEQIIEELELLSYEIIGDDGILRRQYESVSFMNISIKRENFKGDIIGNGPIDGHYRFHNRIPDVMTFKEWYERT